MISSCRPFKIHNVSYYKKTNDFEAARRIFLLGAPECNKNENAMAISEYFSWKCILVGDLLQREVRNKTHEGQRIAECFAAHKLGKFEFKY